MPPPLNFRRSALMAEADELAAKVGAPAARRAAQRLYFCSLTGRGVAVPRCIY